jgi:hypothetical protein
VFQEFWLKLKGKGRKSDGFLLVVGLYGELPDGFELG